MEKREPILTIDRISILAAAILLTYTLANFVQIPGQVINIQLPGLFLSFNLDTEFFVSLLVIGLTAAGTDWLVRVHPHFEGQYTIQHWLLPTLTAWAIGVVLFQQPIGITWWVMFGLGGLALILVLLAEYIVIDPDASLQIPATVGITALSFALLLILMISIRANESRLFVLVPAVTVAVGLTSLRTLHLRLKGEWAYLPTILIAVLVGQISAALNYLPLKPIPFGLFLLGPAYALTSFMGGLLEQKRWQQIITEPVFVLLFLWIVALISG